MNIYLVFPCVLSQTSFASGLQLSYYMYILPCDIYIFLRTNLTSALKSEHKILNFQVAYTDIVRWRCFKIRNESCMLRIIKSFKVMCNRAKLNLIVIKMR
jgi:hypothetical protein